MISVFFDTNVLIHLLNQSGIELPITAKYYTSQKNIYEYKHGLKRYLMDKYFLIQCLKAKNNLFETDDILQKEAYEIVKDAFDNILSVIANRGCGGGCTYCTIPRLWGGKGFARPVSEVVAEIKTLSPKRMILLDPSLTSNPDYAAELFQALRPLNIKWSGLCTLDVVHNPTLFALMIDSGCEGILTGFESISSESLYSVNKRTNKIEDYRQAVREFHKAGISNTSLRVMKGFIAI